MGVVAVEAVVAHLGPVLTTPMTAETTMQASVVVGGLGPVALGAEFPRLGESHRPAIGPMQPVVVCTVVAGQAGDIAVVIDQALVEFVEVGRAGGEDVRWAGVVAGGAGDLHRLTGVATSVGADRWPVAGQGRSDHRMEVAPGDRDRIGAGILLATGADQDRQRQEEDIDSRWTPHQNPSMSESANDGPVVSSLVVTLARDADVERVLAALAADPRFTLGQREGSRVAVVSEDPNRDAAEATYRWLRDECPSLDYVDLVSAFLDPGQ